MKKYILKLKATNTHNYNLYDGETLVSDSDLATLFGSAGSAYFAFNFNSLSPDSAKRVTIVDSNNAQIMDTSLVERPSATVNYKGVWAAGASTFSTFAVLPGRTLDESELTDLMGKIKEGSIKTLTSADVNYPANDPTKISLYSLDYGVYKIIGPVSIVFGNSSTSVQSGFDRTAVVMPGNGTYKTIGWGYNVKDLEWKDVHSDTGSSGSAYTGTISDSLNYSSVEHPLSAKQGKVLKGLIDALDTPFTGTDGTAAGTKGLVPAPATTDAGKFLKADGSWAEAGGGVKTLTEADYNYPTTGTADRICPWLLNPGYYWVKAGTTVSKFDSYGNHSSVSLAEGGFILVGNAFYVTGSNQANRAVFWSDGSTVEGGRVHYNTETGAALMSGDGNSKGEILNAGWVSNSAGNQSTLVITQQAATQLIYPSGFETSKNAVVIGKNSSTTLGSGSSDGAVAIGRNATTKNGVAIGGTSSMRVSAPEESVVIGSRVNSTADYSVVIGVTAKSTAYQGIAIGGNAIAGHNYSIAIGDGSATSVRGEVNFGKGISGSGAHPGYNNTNYRLLTGIYDGQSAHDAATVGQLPATLTNSQFNSILETA